MGYVKGRSMLSLGAGLGFGTLYAVSGNLIRKNAEYGQELALATSLVLLGAVGPRALTTRKRVPVVMGTLGLVSSGYFARKVYQNVYGV
ncbi:hypothetical protein HDU98_001845 [Podochytrium sp. JEL0797]|nr:hypothetical protein HDU98_001845 [Podochytrium sp. JEL0797]